MEQKSLKKNELNHSTARAKMPAKKVHYKNIVMSSKWMLFKSLFFQSGLFSACNCIWCVHHTQKNWPKITKIEKGYYTYTPLLPYPSQNYGLCLHTLWFKRIASLLNLVKSTSWEEKATKKVAFEFESICHLWRVYVLGLYRAFRAELSSSQRPMT